MSPSKPHPPPAEGVSSGPSAHSHGLRRPRALGSGGIHSPPAPAGLRAERRLRPRRLRGLRARVSASVSAERCARRPAGLARRPWLGAWRVSVAWPVCVCEPAGARRPRRPPPRLCLAGARAREGAGAQRASGAAAAVCPPPSPPAPAPSAGLAAARPLPPPLPARCCRGRTHARRHTPAGRGPRLAPPLQPRPRGRLSPGHAPAPGPAHPAGTRSCRRRIQQLEANLRRGGPPGMRSAPQRPPEDARTPRGSLSSGVYRPHPDPRSPRPARRSVLKRWQRRGVWLLHPILQERQLRLGKRSNSPKVTQRA